MQSATLRNVGAQPSSVVKPVLRLSKDRSTPADIRKIRLSNGLTVILKEAHTAPVTSFCIWYRVGSRNEHLGITGVSHWVEHMMFKGTARFTESDIDRMFSRVGGETNAFTSLDFTTYYATVPANNIDLAIALEADRMVNSLFKLSEVASERTVIINEREGSENSPVSRLFEEVQSAAFRVHPYGHEVIGHLSDLKSMTRDDLYGHYQRYYVPNNAIISVAGDFNTADMLRKLKQQFGAIKPSKTVPAVTAEEPPQRGERRVIVKGEGTTNYLALAFRAPNATHADYMPLVALDSVLCGASGLSFFGGGTSNRSSRLSKALVDTGLCADFGGGVSPSLDPSLYTLMGTIMNGQDIQVVEQKLWAEIERIRQTPVEQADLDKALKQTRAQVAFSTETVTNQAFWLGFSEIIQDYSWFSTFLERLKKVTVKDVQRVAAKYLNRDCVTVGQYLATNGAPNKPTDKNE